MKSGNPPSSHAFARGTVALDTERGNLRESLGGLRNLAQLLHSLRVGTRPLSNVLPAARDACDPLRHAMEQILVAAREALGETSATSSLEAYVGPRIHELEAALTEAAERPLSVKMRLSLEERVTRLSQELDTARGLFDLLADSIGGSAMRLDVLELARQSFAGPPSGGSWPRETLVATLSGEDSGLEVLVNPRATTALIALGVELVADPKDASQIPNIRVTPTESGCHLVVERRTNVAGEDLMLLRRGIIEPTLPVVTAAAHVNGAALELAPSKTRFTLTFDQAFSGRVAGETA
jgi:hypothetical protein